ncbi:MAG: ATP-binding cassette domain-containing protein [Chloroflexota bacterium]|nr:ATP-binding cassette domain-containing protein [Chloroflexota bacterium]
MQNAALANATAPLIQTTGLTCRFGAFTAVAGLDLTVWPGEVFALLGPNGAGKSTTIKMLITLLLPTAGQASVGGYDVVRQAGAVRRLLGYVPQALSADGALTGYENLLIFAQLYDVPRREQRARVLDALDFMGLADKAAVLVRDYSGGMVRRLEIAQALIHYPRVLFLDEPTVGLDPVARRAVWDHLDRLRHEFGATLFLTTHYMDEAEQLATRVAVMNQGRISALGTVAELKAQVPGDAPTLEDVFAHFTGDTLESGGSYRETRALRRTARRLG